MIKEKMPEKVIVNVLDMLRLVLILLAFPTLQSTAKQSIQLRVDLSLLLQHVEQQLVLGGTVNLCLLQPALHNLQLRILLSRLQTLTATTQQKTVINYFLLLVYLKNSQRQRRL